jgi:hypothetical protein
MTDQPEGRCPRCNWRALHRSRTRFWEWPILVMVRRHPFRCANCCRRFWLTPQYSSSSHGSSRQTRDAKPDRGHQQWTAPRSSDEAYG